MIEGEWSNQGPQSGEAQPRSGLASSGRFAASRRALRPSPPLTVQVLSAGLPVLEHNGFAPLFSGSPDGSSSATHVARSGASGAAAAGAGVGALGPAAVAVAVAGYCTANTHLGLGLTRDGGSAGGGYRLLALNPLAPPPAGRGIVLVRWVGAGSTAAALRLTRGTPTTHRYLLLLLLPCPFASDSCCLLLTWLRHQFLACPVSGGRAGPGPAPPRAPPRPHRCPLAHRGRRRRTEAALRARPTCHPTCTALAQGQAMCSGRTGGAPRLDVSVSLL